MFHSFSSFPSSLVKTSQHPKLTPSNSAPPPPPSLKKMSRILSQQTQLWLTIVPMKDTTGGTLYLRSMELFPSHGHSETCFQHEIYLHPWVGCSIEIIGANLYIIDISMGNFLHSNLHMYLNLYVLLCVYVST